MCFSVNFCGLTSGCERSVGPSKDQLIVEGDCHAYPLRGAFAELQVWVHHVAGTPDSGDVGVAGIVGVQKVPCGVS